MDEQSQYARKDEHYMTNTFLEQIKKVAAEIENKKLAPMDKVIRVLQEHGGYCDNCEADDPVFFDMTGAKPVIRCLWCGESVTLESIIRKARSLPDDYLTRMIARPARETFIERIGEATWITDGYLAEIAGDRKFSYPDRDKFKKTDNISKVLNGLDLDSYEEAAISKTLYRQEYGGCPIAALKSQSHTVYINNDFAKHIYGIFVPYINEPMQPVLIKAHGEICRLIMPVRFNPEEIKGS